LRVAHHKRVFDEALARLEVVEGLAGVPPPHRRESCVRYVPLVERVQIGFSEYSSVMKFQ